VCPCVCVCAVFISFPHYLILEYLPSDSQHLFASFFSTNFLFSLYGIVSYCRMISDTFKCLHTIHSIMYTANYTLKTYYVHFSITRSVYGADDVHGFAVTVPIKSADGTVTHPAIKPYDDADSSGINIPFILSSILYYFLIFLLIRQVLLYRIKFISHF
jgi:hypothetical protein